MANTRRMAAIAAPLATDKPEFLVFVCGGDEFVGVRLDADGEAHQDVLDDARLAGDGVEALDLGHRVHHDVAYSGFDRGGQLGDRFIVAVQGDPLRRKVGVQRDGQLSAGATRPARGPLR